MSNLGDCFTLQRGRTYKSKLLDQPGPVLLGLATIARNGGFRDDNLTTYGGDSPEELLVRPGELYVSLKDVTQSGDLLGSVARLPSAVELGRLTQDTVKLQPRPGCLPLDYLYWLMRTPQYRAHCRGHATGTTNLGLAREDFLSFEIPTLTPDRELLTRVIESLDDKIEQNRRTAAKLEALARATFRAWFVDFAPVHAKAAGQRAYPGLPPAAFAALPTTFADSPLGPVPAGWTAGSMGDVGRQRRESVSGEELLGDDPYIGLEHLPRRSIMLNEWESAAKVTSNKSRFRKGDILFGKLRPYFHKVGPAPVDGVCSTDIVVVYPKHPRWSAWLLMLLFSDDFVSHANQTSAGTKMPRTNWRDMASYSVAIPPDAIVEAFEATVGPMLAWITSAVHESRHLAALRDYLLPRLLSGAVRIKGSDQ